MSTTPDPKVGRRLDIDGYAVVTIDEHGWTAIEHRAEVPEHQATLDLSPRQATRLIAFLTEVEGVAEGAS